MAQITSRKKIWILLEILISFFFLVKCWINNWFDSWASSYNSRTWSSNTSNSLICAHIIMGYNLVVVRVSNFLIWFFLCWMYQGHSGENNLIVRVYHHNHKLVPKYTFSQICKLVASCSLSMVVLGDFSFLSGTIWQVKAFFKFRIIFRFHVIP